MCFLADKAAHKILAMMILTIMIVMIMGLIVMMMVVRRVASNAVKKTRKSSVEPMIKQGEKLA